METVTAMETLVDLGWMKLESITDDQGKDTGLIWTHRAKSGQECVGFVDTNSKKPSHRITVTKPLSVTPSLWCSECGLHGFMTGGKWTGDGQGTTSLLPSYPVARLVPTSSPGVWRVVND